MMLPDRAGTLFVVGLGPGSAGLLTPDASAALDAADTVVGYRGYLEQVADRLAGKHVVGRELGEEVDRAAAALDLAAEGRTVALVSSGDAGVYGMGGLAHELAATRADAPEIVMIPGVTAALSAAALLGAPLAHDWACISLSDLLTPREQILRRVEAAARGDFVIVLYNPASRTRTRLLGEAIGRILGHREPTTPVGLVENAYRPGQRVRVTTLEALRDDSSPVSMFTTVIVGGSQTFVAGGRMITPRIHAAKLKAGAEPVADRKLPAAVEPGARIMAESLAIIDRELGFEPADMHERAIVKRMIHASADFDFARAARFAPGAIASALEALRAGAVVVTDVEMLRAGIRRDLAGPLGIEVVCGLNDPGAAGLAEREGLTRSAAGMRLAAARVRGDFVVAVGNAPTALDEVVRLARDEGWRPRCVVGMPVGFVGVEEAKRRLVEEVRIPSIVCLGRKGGTAVAAAAVNALLELARDGLHP